MYKFHKYFTEAIVLSAAVTIPLFSGSSLTTLADEAPAIEIVETETADASEHKDGRRYEIPERGIALTISKAMEEKGITMEPSNENTAGYKNQEVSFYYRPVTDKLIDQMSEYDTAEEQAAHAEEFYDQFRVHCKCILYIVMMTDDQYADAQSGGKSMEEICAGYDGGEVIGSHNGYTYIASIPTLSTDGMSDEEKTLYEECRSYMKEVKDNIEFIDVRTESDQTNVGDRMPDFTTTDLDGNTVTQDIFSEKDLTVVNVWGTFCNPCIGEMPELGKWADEMPENVQIIGFVSDITGSDDGEHLDLARKITEKAGVHFKNLITGDPQFNGFMSGIVGVPTTFIVDSQGNILGDPIVGAHVEDYKKAVEENLS